MKQKAVLLIDCLPEDWNIEDCEIEYTIHNNKNDLELDSSWEPLKKLPERQEQRETEEYFIGVKVGWNDCLKVISGEIDYAKYR